MNSNQIRWGCRRGMLELDIFLLPFFDSRFERLSLTEKKYFVELLSATDPELFSWLMGYTIPPNEELTFIVSKIREYRKHQK